MTKEYEFCLRCGRRLKNEEHKKLGYGPTCYKKIRLSRLKKKSIIGVIDDPKTRTVGP